MKRKREPEMVDLQELVQTSDDPFAPVSLPDTEGEPTMSDGRAVFTLHCKLAAHLTERYVLRRRKEALQELAAASREKGAVYPAALESTNGTVIDMISLVTHTGSRFLARSDLYSSDCSGGIRPLCPPDADTATVQRFASEATAALIDIMADTPPAALPLDVIMEMMEQAQYLGAIFIVRMLPYYFQPLAYQLSARQASEVLARWLCAVQGAEALDAYRELIQFLAPAIASPSVPVAEVSAAALRISAQSVCGLGTERSNEAYALLVELAKGLATFKPVALSSVAKLAELEQPPDQRVSSYASGRDDVSVALMCLLYASAACFVCAGACGQAAPTTDGVDASKADTAAQGVAASQENAGGSSICSDSKTDGPVTTLRRCVTRCCALLLDEGGPLRAHTAAVMTMFTHSSVVCSCRSVALEAALDRRSPLQHVASGPCNRCIVVARTARRVVVAAKLLLPEAPLDTNNTRRNDFGKNAASLPSVWGMALFVPKHPGVPAWYLGVHNRAEPTIALAQLHFLLLEPSADLHPSSVSMAKLRHWARSNGDTPLSFWRDAGLMLGCAESFKGQECKVPGSSIRVAPLQEFLDRSLAHHRDMHQSSQRDYASLSESFTPGKNILVCMALEEASDEQM